jgi:hypothetical protein
MLILRELSREGVFWRGILALRRCLLVGLLGAKIARQCLIVWEIAARSGEETYAAGGQWLGTRF